MKSHPREASGTLSLTLGDCEVTLPGRVSTRCAFLMGGPEMPHTPTLRAPAEPWRCASGVVSRLAANRPGVDGVDAQADGGAGRQPSGRAARPR